MGVSADFEQNIFTIAFSLPGLLWRIENCRRYEKSHKNWKEKTNRDRRTSKLETQILFTEQKALLRLPKQFHFVDNQAVASENSNDSEWPTKWIWIDLSLLLSAGWSVYFISQICWLNWIFLFLRGEGRGRGWKYANLKETDLDLYGFGW